MKTPEEPPKPLKVIDFKVGLQKTKPKEKFPEAQNASKKEVVDFDEGWRKLRLDKENLAAADKHFQNGQDTDEWEDARDEYLMALRYNPKHLYASIGLAAIYSKSPGKDFKKAEIYYKRAIELRPNLTLLYLDLGTLYFRAGEFDLAEANYLLALKGEPESLDAKYNLGVVYYTKNDYHKALKYYESYKRSLSPGEKEDMEKVKNWIAECKKRLPQEVVADSNKDKDNEPK